LKNGLVLIAGGSYESATAELYDPVTGTFSSTGDMALPRFGHAATLLPDGRVLMVGGGDKNFALLRTAEIYDPVTGTFGSAGQTRGQHALASASLLGSGKVLITDVEATRLGAQAELFDPATLTFDTAGLFYGGQTVPLGDGRIVAGSSILLYEFSGAGLTPLVRDFSGLLGRRPSLLASQILFAGGGECCDEPTTDVAWLFDPDTRSVQATGSLRTDRKDYDATVLPGGRVLISGGQRTFYPAGYYLTTTVSLAEAEEYDPGTGTFTSAGRSQYTRNEHTATLLLDGTVLLVGGSGQDPAELYIPATRAASAATLSGPLAADSIGSIFGARLASTTASSDPPAAPTILGDISLRVRDSSGIERLAPLFYVSPSQINFAMPADIQPGDVTLEVVNAPGEDFRATAKVLNVAPGIFRSDNNIAAGYGVRIEPNGSRTVLDIRNTVTLDDRPVYLTLYATGVRNRSSLDNVQLTIGGVRLPVEYAGPSGDGIAGLDQINVRLTLESKFHGITDLALNVDGASSNTVRIRIQ
jgi:uncharacterized protein (TIGR03437 family)